MTRFAALAVALLLLTAWPSAAADGRLNPSADAGIEPRLGASVPRDLRFADETRAPVTLARCLGEKPVLLAPVDYDCGNICGVTLAGLFSALDALPFTAGEAFELIAVSIDAREGSDEAAAAKAEHLRRYSKPGAAAGIHFLTERGDGAAAALAEAIGFRYRFDPATDQFAHPAAVAVLTPEGGLARWMYGFPLEPDDLRLALTEASGGAIGTFADRVWLLCYRYDPVTGSYTPAIWEAIRVAGTLTCLALGGYVLLALRRERRGRGPAS